MTWLIDIDALDAQDQPATLRYSLGRYDAPDDAFYDPRIEQPGLYEAGLYAGELLDQGRSGHGETTLINADGALDGLADYAVDGRQMMLRRHDGTLQTVLAGTVSRLSFEPGLVSIKLREPLEPLKTSHPHEVYAGDNSLPDGLEGADDDIGGSPKPLLFGQARNATPDLVNTARLIYQVSSRSDCQVQAVYDQGSELEDEGDYASLSELQSTAPAEGKYRSYQGYVRLGLSAGGAVTVDATTSQPLAGDVAAELAADRGWTIAAGDVTALNQAGPVRLYVTDATNTLDLLDRIAVSVGGYISAVASGELRIRRITAPGTPLMTLHDYEIIDAKRSANGAGPNGLPIRKVTLNTDRIETTQTDLNGNVPESRRSRLARTTRPVSATRQATADRHPLADEITIDSVLGSRSHAQAIADDLVELLGVRRDVVTVTARVSVLQSLSVGEWIEIETPRYGYADGRVMLVTGYRIDAITGELNINLWG
ncbi:hypothetical protein QWY79_03660 [Halomonas sabkhae]|uniref:hypothetical protein n=1 Tax=Halomonas sabkhae TaxID=626223 RepID=UPI0025B52220|nr:hypothetical protein [Halomonas sabkhae]MDN3524359.1 hypothetical protein [Halomonas sabkhae]